MEDNVKKIAIKLLNEHNDNLAELKQTQSDICIQLEVLEKNFSIGTAQIKASLQNFQFINEELTLEEKFKICNSVIEKVKIESVVDNGAIRKFTLTILPMPKYVETIGTLAIEFNIDKSSGKGLWEILSPFNQKCDEWFVKATKNKKYARR